MAETRLCDVLGDVAGVVTEELVSRHVGLCGVIGITTVCQYMLR